MNEQPSPLFRYGPLADYEPPPWPATENVRRGMRAWWCSVRHRRSVAVPAVEPATLTPLPAARLEAVACHQRAEPLNGALVTALAGWAATRGWALITPPRRQTRF